MAPILNTFKCENTINKFSGLICMCKISVGIYFHSICSCGSDFQKQHWESAFSSFVSSETPTLLPIEPSQILPFSVMASALVAILRLLQKLWREETYYYNPILVCHIIDACNWTAHQPAALHPSQSLSAISTANHPAQMWLCHWELQVPLEFIWSMCGYVLFDIVTIPSCTSGRRIALKKDAFLLGRTQVSFYFAPYFPILKKKKIIWKTGFPTCIKTTELLLHSG